MRTSRRAGRRVLWRPLAVGAAVVAFAGAIGVSNLAYAATLFTANFEDGSISSWSKSGGAWAVATDGTRVMQQSNPSSDLAREFNGSSSWTNYVLQARVKVLSFVSSDGFAGVAARSSTSTTFDRVVLLTGGRVQLQAVNSGAVTVLGTASLGISAGTWFTVRIEESGTTVRGFVNGTQIGSGASQGSTGRIGAQTFHATANFDDFSVTDGTTPPPSSPPPTSPPPTSPPPQTGLVGFGAGTTGGGGGPTVTVTSLAALTTAAAATTTQIVRVNGNFTCSADVRVASNKTIIGVGANSGLTGCGLNLRDVNNVIVQNMKIAKVPAGNGNGDAIHIDHSTHLWIDHNDLSSDTTHGTDFYDGLLDITHAADLITVSWNILHDHIKCSLIGHSDSNGSEDTGHLRVTYHHNFFNNCDQRLPSLRFGTGHVYNNYFNAATTAVHSRMGAQMLVQNNVFRNVGTPIETTRDSSVDGFVNESGNDFGGGTNRITQTGTFTNPPYSFTLTATSSVISVVTAGAGTGKIA
jgi:pectate lyase